MKLEVQIDDAYIRCIHQLRAFSKMPTKDRLSMSRTLLERTIFDSIAEDVIAQFRATLYKNGELDALTDEELRIADRCGIKLEEKGSKRRKING